MSTANESPNIRTHAQIVEEARRRNRIRDGLVLCENCDTPADRMSYKMGWTGCASCIFGEADSFDEESLIHVEVQR